MHDVLNGAWQSEAYREQLFRNISSTVVNSAFGLIMGPVGGMFMTIAAPQMLETQLAFNGINVLNAYQYYLQTGDVRLLLIRGIRSSVNVALTVMQWRLNLQPSCNCLGHCFPAGTLAATEHGQRPIESIRQDDFVWAFDLKTGQWKLCRVLETFTRINDDSLLSLIYRDGSIQVTPGHPFWVTRGEDLEARPWPEHAGERITNAAIPGRWVDAGDLRVGDVLYLRSGEERVIEEIQVHAGGQMVYNLHVEGLHSYGVGFDQVLVHNGSKKGKGRRGGNQFRRGRDTSEQRVGIDKAKRKSQEERRRLEREGREGCGEPLIDRDQKSQNREKNAFKKVRSRKDAYREFGEEE